MINREISFYDLVLYLVFFGLCVCVSVCMCVLVYAFVAITRRYLKQFLLVQDESAMMGIEKKLKRKNRTLLYYYCEKQMKIEEN